MAGRPQAEIKAPTTERRCEEILPPQRGGIFVETVGSGAAPQCLADKSVKTVKELLRVPWERGAICFLRSGQIVQLKDLGQSGTVDLAPG
jgi:hypothetical protein